MKALYALVGMQHRGTVKLVASLPAGEILTLVREPNNNFDPNAIQVWARGQHVGFVKAVQARPLAVRMDLEGFVPPTGIPPIGLSIEGKLANSGDRWPMIEVDE